MNRLAPLAIAAALAATPVASEDLSPEQVKELALEAILENPQIIMDAIAILQEREADEAAAAAAEQLSIYREELLNDPNAPVIGNPDGDVTLVEFFDYNCPYCRRAGTAVKQLIADDPNLRVVYREWPILGPESVIASRAALASRKQGKYEEFHWALMGLEGRISENMVMHLASELGMDIDQLKIDMEAPEVDDHIQLTTQMSQRLGFNGTPAFVIGDQTIPGFVEKDQLAQLVERIREDS